MRKLIVTSERRHDLNYWREKLIYAQSNNWGNRRAELENVSRMMIDTYLDFVINDNNSYEDSTKYLDLLAKN